MTVKEAIRYLKKFPPLAKVVLNINDDEGLVYSDLIPTGFKSTTKGLYATFAEDPHNKELQG